MNGSNNSGNSSFEGAEYWLYEVVNTNQKIVAEVKLDKNGKGTFEEVQASDGTNTDKNGNLLLNNLNAIYFITEKKPRQATTLTLLSTTSP